MLQVKGSTILLLFSLLEYAVHKASYKRSKFPHFSISSNINSRQNGAKMYPSRDVTFISALMNSFVLYVKSLLHNCKQLPCCSCLPRNPVVTQGISMSFSYWTTCVVGPAIINVGCCHPCCLAPPRHQHVRAFINFSCCSHSHCC